MRAIKTKGSGIVSHNIWEDAGYKSYKKKEKQFDDKNIPLAFNLPHEEQLSVEGDVVEKKIWGMNNKQVKTVLGLSLVSIFLGLGYVGFIYLKKLKK